MIRIVFVAVLLISIEKCTLAQIVDNSLPSKFSQGEFVQQQSFPQQQQPVQSQFVQQPQPYFYDDNANTPVRFISPRLSYLRFCGELTKQDCLLHREASEQCPNTCANKVTDYGTGIARTGCFHGDQTIMTDRGVERIADLPGRRNVKVLTRSNANGRATFSEIDYWLHASSSIEMKYIDFLMESGQNLSITEEHLIYQTDCNGENKQTVLAERIQPGTCLYVQRNGQFFESKVVSRNVSTKKGIYAPFTLEGNIVVNDVLASCYTHLENEPLQKIMYSYIRWIQDRLFTFPFFHNNPFDVKVTIPQAVFNFLDISNKFCL